MKVTVTVSTLDEIFSILESDLKNHTHTDIRLSDNCEGIETEPPHFAGFFGRNDREIMHPKIS